MIYRQTYQSPLGEMFLLADDAALLGVYFVGQKYERRGYESVDMIAESNTILEQTKAWLDAYFAGAQPTLADLVVEPRGTAFQRKVWTALAAIPYGETVTYGQLGTAVGCKSAQAIGGAVGKNPISILIPCHRVVASDGSLTGYAGGLERKAWLLEHERSSDDYILRIPKVHDL